MLVFAWQCTDYPISSPLIKPHFITQELRSYMRSELPNCRHTARILLLNCRGGNAILANELLKSIESVTDKAIGEVFHMLYGVGSGALPAGRLSLYNAGSSNQIYSAGQLGEFYKEYRLRFYSPVTDVGCWSGLLSLCSPTEYMYDTSVLYTTATASFGNLKMSQLSNDVVIPCWDREEECCVVARSYNCGHRGYEDYYLRDLVTGAMSTSSFFNPFSLQNVNYGMMSSFRNVVSAENIMPNFGIEALKEAFSLYHNADSYLLVSIGFDGYQKKHYPSNTVVPDYYSEDPLSFYRQLSDMRNLYNKPIIRCHLEIPSYDYYELMFEVDDLLKKYLISVIEDRDAMEKIHRIADVLRRPMTDSAKLKKACSWSPIVSNRNNYFEVIAPQSLSAWGIDKSI